MAAVALALGASVVKLAWNGGQKPEPPAEEDAVILRVAGLEVRHSEILACEDYVEKLDPTIGEMARKRAILDLYLLPVKLAQRDFPKERAEQRRSAETLAKFLGDSAGYDDLATQSKRFPGARLEQGVVRAAMSLPEARWAFADEHIGRVSPILETPRGYSILATLDKRPGPTMHYDAADVWVAPFHTHELRAYTDWLATAKASLSGQLTFIHDDYKEALPYWLRQ